MDDGARLAADKADENLAIQIKAIKRLTIAAFNRLDHRFQRKGQVLIPKAQIGEEELMGLVLDAGAEDLKSDEESWEILTPVEKFDAVVEAVHKRKLEPSSARLTYVPLTLVPVTDESLAKRVIHLVEALDEHDDVQRVHSNFDIPDEMMTKLQG